MKTLPVPRGLRDALEEFSAAAAVIGPRSKEKSVTSAGRLPKCSWSL